MALIKAIKEKNKDCELRRKEMTIIANIIQSFEINELNKLYPILFGYKLSTVYNGKTKNIILHFNNLFKLNELNKNQSIITSKIYYKKNELTGKSTNNNDNFNGNIIHEMQRRTLTIIATKYYSFTLDNLIEFYKIEFKNNKISNIHTGGGRGLKFLIEYFNDLFFVNKQWPKGRNEIIYSKNLFKDLQDLLS